MILDWQATMLLLKTIDENEDESLEHDTTSEDSDDEEDLSKMVQRITKNNGGINKLINQLIKNN